MAIEITPSENPEYKPTLKVNKLSVGDYITLSIDRMYREFPDTSGKGYGKSYLLFTDVFDYSFFDAKARKVVDVKEPEALRCSWFCSESLWQKIEKHGENVLIRIEAVETKSGQVTYGVRKIVDDDTQPSTPSDDKLKVGEEVTVEEVKLVTEPAGQTKEDLIELIKKFKAVDFTDDAIVNTLKDKYPEESIRELLKVE